MTPNTLLRIEVCAGSSLLRHSIDLAASRLHFA